MKHSLPTMSTIFALALGTNSLFAQDADIIDQISRSAVPKTHLGTLLKIINEYQVECERFHTSEIYSEYIEPIPVLQIDPQSIYRIKVHQNGLEATVFQANPKCGKFGNIWRATGSIRTFVLVNDSIFENWLSGPPETLNIDGQIVLILPLDQEQCSYLDENVIVDVADDCFGALIWEPAAGDFYGYGTPLFLNLEI